MKTPVGSMLRVLLCCSFAKEIGASLMLTKESTANIIDSQNSIDDLVHRLEELEDAPGSAVRDECLSMPNELRDEISGYESVFNSMVELVLNGSMKGVAYNGLGYIVDTYGARFTGTQNLENAIDQMVDIMRLNHMENVHTENVTVPIWKRNNESLYMIRPRFQKMAILGLGSSVGTPGIGGIIADIVVVQSFDELNRRAREISGKIVVYNQPYLGYGKSVAYRTRGASEAAKHGAVAALVRSVTQMSVYSPHTGWQSYEDNVNKIPVACITVEDAEMFQRITNRGEVVTVRLEMGAETLPDGTSRNVVSELTGRSRPEEVVIVSGHIDSWDVGQGAMDDGGGFYISAMAPFVAKTLGLRPLRTFRTVLWTSEEPGLVGASSYRQSHADELSNFNIVLESDEGTFNPKGLSFSGTKSAACIVKEVLKILAPLNATDVTVPDYGSDTGVFSQAGVPTASLVDDNDPYFIYHHSNGDTMTVEISDPLDRCLVAWSFIGYVLADLSVRLPWNETFVAQESNSVEIA